MHNPQLRFLEDIKKLKYNKPKRPLLISTDCSGIEAPIMALNILKIPHINLWNSDIDENVIKSIATQNGCPSWHPFPPAPFGAGQLVPKAREL